MKSILVGIDGSARGKRALRWATARAERDNSPLKLLSVVDSRFIEGAGFDKDETVEAVERELALTADSVREEHPGLEVETEVEVGGIVDELVDEADESAIVVLGSHHGSKVGETIGGAKGLRVSVSAKVPTVVVPADWDACDAGKGIVVGVGPHDESNNAAVSFAVREALASGEAIHLVSAWGLPAFLSRPAEAMGGGLGPVGEQFEQRLVDYVDAIKAEYPQVEVTYAAVEGPSPTRVLLDQCDGRAMLVLGTRPLGMLGRALFGSVPHSVLQNLAIPTVVVPQQ